MSFWDMKLLEPGEELQDLLCEAEYLLEQQGIVLFPVTDFRLKVHQYLYKNIIKENIGGLEASDFRFYLSTAYKHLNIILGHEEVLGIFRANTMLNPWDKRETCTVSNRTGDFIEFILGRNVSTVY